MNPVRPELLGIVPLVAALLALAVVMQWLRARRLERALGRAALTRLWPRRARGFPGARLVCLVLAAAASALGAVGFTQEEPEPPPPPAPLDLAIAVDVSLSMSAGDSEPTRIGRASEVIAGLAGALPQARTALVVFASWPYTLVPPTDDPSVVRWFAETLEADLVLERDQGTSLSSAIAHARQALAARPREGARRVVLVLSDGGAHDGEAAVLREASASAEDGVEIWTAGLGSERGEELVTETGPVLDRAGRPVLARLDEELLRGAAAAGGGRFERVDDDRGVRALIDGLRGSGAAPAAETHRPADPAALFALLALPLLLLEGAWDGGRGLLPMHRGRGA